VPPHAAQVGALKLQLAAPDLWQHVAWSGPPLQEHVHPFGQLMLQGFTQRTIRQKTFPPKRPWLQLEE
jgi:hypothetical protein